jgi:hypothetical protein
MPIMSIYFSSNDNNLEDFVGAGVHVGSHC